MIWYKKPTTILGMKCEVKILYPSPLLYQTISGLQDHCIKHSQACVVDITDSTISSQKGVQSISYLDFTIPDNFCFAEPPYQAISMQKLPDIDLWCKSVLKQSKIMFWAILKHYKYFRPAPATVNIGHFAGKSGK